MKWLIYNIVFFFAYLALMPRFLRRMWRRGGYRRGFFERIGRFSGDLPARLGARRRVWIHAVSVGEMYVAMRIAREMRERRPGLALVFTVTTSTGRAVAEKQIEKDDVLLYFPVDTPWIVRRVLNAVQPLALVLVETEIWPNLLRALSRRRTPVILVNGRISDRSYRGFSRLRVFVREIFGALDLVCVQGREDSERMIGLGARPERVHVMGTAKYDEAAAAGAVLPPTDVLRSAGFPVDAILLVGGSTWPGEETVLLDLYCRLQAAHPRLRLVLVPRHAERAAEVVAEIEKAGLRGVRRSLLGGAAGAPAPAEVLLVDTTGELKSFYAAADIVFVGKSLTQHGGQNIIEPAALGKPVIVGPNMENFRPVMADFLAAGAVLQVPDAAALGAAVERLLGDPSARAEYARIGRDLVRGKAGVVKATVSLIAETCPALFARH